MRAVGLSSANCSANSVPLLKRPQTAMVRETPESTYYPLSGGGGKCRRPRRCAIVHGVSPAGTATPASLDPALVGELAAIVGRDAVVSRSAELKVYEGDGWTIEKCSPDLLVMPRTTEQVSAVLKALWRREVAFVPRGAGTGLSGGALPVNAPVMICTSKMNRILAVDLANRRVEVESGVVNLHVTNAVKRERFLYAPDPSSQQACTIGGNIAENSGGPHTLKYGVTTNHVLGVTVVLA